MIREQLVGDAQRLDDAFASLKDAEVKATERAKSRGVQLEQLNSTYRRCFDMVINRYSAGSPIDEVAAWFTDVPRLLSISPEPFFEPADAGSSYLRLLDVASLMALFEHVEGARYVADVVDSKGVEDFFVDSFIASLIPFREPCDTLQSETIRRTLGVKAKRPLYAGLREAAELAVANESAAAAARLRKYVSGEWFGPHKSAFDWNVPPRGRAPFDGHGCFPAAAVAKVFDINDAPIQGHKYYPGDLIQR